MDSRLIPCGNAIFTLLVMFMPSRIMPDRLTWLQTRMCRFMFHVLLLLRDNSAFDHEQDLVCLFLVRSGAGPCSNSVRSHACIWKTIVLIRCCERPTTRIYLSCFKRAISLVVGPQEPHTYLESPKVSNMLLKPMAPCPSKGCSKANRQRTAVRLPQLGAGLNRFNRSSRQQRLSKHIPITASDVPTSVITDDRNPR